MCKENFSLLPPRMLQILITANDNTGVLSHGQSQLMLSRHSSIYIARVTKSFFILTIRKAIFRKQANEKCNCSRSSYNYFLCSAYTSYSHCKQLEDIDSCHSTGSSFNPQVNNHFIVAKSSLLFILSKLKATLKHLQDLHILPIHRAVELYSIHIGQKISLLDWPPVLCGATRLLFLSGSACESAIPNKAKIEDFQKG